MDRIYDLKAKHWASDVASLERWKAMRPKISDRLQAWVEQHISEQRERMIERYGKTACKGL